MFSKISAIILFWLLQSSEQKTPTVTSAEKMPCSKNCECSLTGMTCTGSSLQFPLSVPPHIKSIVITNLSRPYLPCGGFTSANRMNITFIHLQTLSMTDCFFGNVIIEHLYFAKSRIEKLKCTSFSTSELESFHFHKGSIGFIERFAFFSTSIRYFTISQSNITLVESQAFHRANTEVFQVTDCNVATLEPGLFSGDNYPNLKNLVFERNKIAELGCQEKPVSGKVSFIENRLRCGEELAWLSEHHISNNTCYLPTESREIDVDKAYLKNICGRRNNYNFCSAKNESLSNSECHAIPANIIDKFQQLSRLRNTIQQNNITVEHLQCIRHRSRKCTDAQDYQRFENLLMRYKDLKRNIQHFWGRNILKVSTSVRTQRNKRKSIKGNVNNTNTKLTSPNDTNLLFTGRKKQFGKIIPGRKDTVLNNATLKRLLELLRKDLRKNFKVVKINKLVRDVKVVKLKGLFGQNVFDPGPQKGNFSRGKILVGKLQQYHVHNLLKVVKTRKRSLPNKIIKHHESRRLKHQNLTHKITKRLVKDVNVITTVKIKYVPLRLISQTKHLLNTSSIPLPESCEVAFFEPFPSKRFGICEEFSNGIFNIDNPENIEDEEYQRLKEEMNVQVNKILNDQPRTTHLQRKRKLVKRNSSNVVPSQLHSMQTNRSSSLEHGKKTIKALKVLKKITRLFLSSVESKLRTKSNSNNFSRNNAKLNHYFELKKSVTLEKISSTRCASSRKNNQQNKDNRRKMKRKLTKLRQLHISIEQGNSTTGNRQRHFIDKRNLSRYDTTLKENMTAKAPEIRTGPEQNESTDTRSSYTQHKQTKSNNNRNKRSSGDKNRRHLESLYTEKSSARLITAWPSSGKTFEVDLTTTSNRHSSDNYGYLDKYRNSISKENNSPVLSSNNLRSSTHKTRKASEWVDSKNGISNSVRECNGVNTDCQQQQQQFRFTSDIDQLKRNRDNHFLRSKRTMQKGIYKQQRLANKKLRKK